MKKENKQNRFKGDISRRDFLSLNVLLNSFFSIFTIFIYEPTIVHINKNMQKLQNAGFIKRVGPDKGGHWEIIKQNNNN